MPILSPQNIENARRLPFYLWLALATLLFLSLTSTTILLTIQTLTSSQVSQPNGLHLIVAISGGMVLTYTLLMLLTRDFFRQQFITLLKPAPLWVLVSISLGLSFAILIDSVSQEIPAPYDSDNTFDLIKQHSQLANFTLIIVVSALAPFFEEYLFRGLILSSLMARFATFKAIVVSAVVFMGFHLLEYYDYWLGLVAVFSLGLLLGLLRIWSRSMLPPILCHASYNLTIILLA